MAATVDVRTVTAATTLALFLYVMTGPSPVYMEEEEEEEEEEDDDDEEEEEEETHLLWPSSLLL